MRRAHHCASMALDDKKPPLKDIIVLKSNVRQLTDEELALVSGGAKPKTVNLDPMTVNASRPSKDWQVYMPVTPGNYGKLIPVPNDQLDRHIDDTARALEKIIKADPRFNTTEIGTLIIKDRNGLINNGELVYGSAADPSSLEFPLQKWGVEPGQVLGIIHSHPASLFPSSTHEINKYPSDNRTIGGVTYEGQDWRMADILRDHGMNPDTFRHYIIGPDGVTREYNFNDRDTETLGERL